MTRTAKLLLVSVFVLQLIFFGFVALHRFVDGDEGFYLLASRLVLMHKKPYLDFLFEQAPLLPYVYALWMKFAGVTWTSAKLFSALLTTSLGTLLYAHVCRQTRNWLAGLAAVIMFVSSTLIFAWFPVVKTFSLAGLFLFAAYVAVSRLSETSSRWLMGAGGLLLGLSVDTRSYLLLLAPVFLWWIFRNSDAGARRPSILWFLGGFTIAMVPCLYFFISSPEVFLFNNLGFHAIRSNEGLIGMWRDKLSVLLMLFFGGAEGNGIQGSLLLALNLAFVFSIGKSSIGRSTRRRRYPPQLAFQIAVTVGVISFLPTPPFLQYFCFCVPFLVVGAVCVVNDLSVTVESRRDRLVATALCVAILGIYLGASANDFRKYLVTGDGIEGVRLTRDKSDWRLQRVIEVSRAIDQVASPAEMVASFWPGYVFQTKADSFPGFEAGYGVLVAEKLTGQQRARYHILSSAEIESDFAAHRPRIVVLGNPHLRLMKELMGDTVKNSLRADGYTLVRSIGDTSIYVCCSRQ